MATKLYVGNLAYSSTNDSLQQAFSKAGNVVSVNVVIDKMTGRSRGFAFVEMDTEEAAQAAIEMFDGKEIDGRPVKVNIARPMEPRAPGGRNFGGGRPGGYQNRGQGGRPDDDDNSRNSW